MNVENLCMNRPLLWVTEGALWTTEKNIRISPKKFRKPLVRGWRRP